MAVLIKWIYGRHKNENAVILIDLLYNLDNATWTTYNCKKR